MENFDEKLESFFNGVVKICEDHMAQEFPNNPKEGKRINKGKRYAKIINLNSEGKDSSVFCFVDMTNGNVLKAAGWSAPAKHARDNIFNEDNGLKCVNPYGVAYLR